MATKDITLHPINDQTTDLYPKTKSTQIADLGQNGCAVVSKAEYNEHLIHTLRKYTYGAETTLGDVYSVVSNKMFVLEGKGLAVFFEPALNKLNLTVSVNNGYYKVENAVPETLMSAVFVSGNFHENISDLSAYRTAAEQNVIDNGKQSKINGSNKLNADYLSDGVTNKPSEWNEKSVVTGTHDGTNWTGLTINGTTKAIPSGGGGGGSGANNIKYIVPVYTGTRINPTGTLNHLYFNADMNVSSLAQLLSVLNYNIEYEEGTYACAEFIVEGEDPGTGDLSKCILILKQGSGESILYGIQCGDKVFYIIPNENAGFVSEPGIYDVTGSFPIKVSGIIDLTNDNMPWANGISTFRLSGGEETYSAGTNVGLLTPFLSFNNNFTTVTPGGLKLYNNSTVIPGQTENVNFKKINGNSVIGSGNISLPTFDNLDQAVKGGVEIEDNEAINYEVRIENENSTRSVLAQAWKPGDDDTDSRALYEIAVADTITNNGEVKISATDGDNINGFKILKNDVQLLGDMGTDNSSIATKQYVDTKSTVSVSDTGTATDEVNYITINGVEKKLPSGGGGGTVLYGSILTANASSLETIDCMILTSQPLTNETVSGANNIIQLLGSNAYCFLSGNVKTSSEYYPALYLKIYGSSAVRIYYGNGLFTSAYTSIKIYPSTVLR